MTVPATTAALVRWVSDQTGLTTIQAYQSVARPAKPYAMVNFLNRRELTQRPAQTHHDVEAGTGNTTAHPLIEVELEFSVNVYGGDPTRPLAVIAQRAHNPEHQEPLFPSIVIHEVGPISSVPELVDHEYEPRAQCRVFLRTLIQDGAPVLPIDSSPTPTVNRA